MASAPTTNDISNQLDNIQGTAEKVLQSLNSTRLFDLLEIVRDSVNRLSTENNQLRKDIADLHKEILSQAANSTPAD